MIKKNLLAILACPKCKGKVKMAKNKSVNRRQERQYILCENCRLRFGVIDNDIPNMLIDEAEHY